MRLAIVVMLGRLTRPAVSSELISFCSGLAATDRSNSVPPARASQAAKSALSSLRGAHSRYGLHTRVIPTTIAAL